MGAVVRFAQGDGCDRRQGEQGEDEREYEKSARALEAVGEGDAVEFLVVVGGGAQGDGDAFSLHVPPGRAATNAQ